MQTIIARDTMNSSDQPHTKSMRMALVLSIVAGYILLILFSTYILHLKFVENRLHETCDKREMTIIQLFFDSKSHFEFIILCSEKLHKFINNDLDSNILKVLSAIDAYSFNIFTKLKLK